MGFAKYAGVRIRYCGCPHCHPSSPGHATVCVHQVTFKLYLGGVMGIQFIGVVFYKVRMYKNGTV